MTDRTRAMLCGYSFKYMDVFMFSGWHVFVSCSAQSAGMCLMFMFSSSTGGIQQGNHTTFASGYGTPPSVLPPLS